MFRHPALRIALLALLLCGARPAPAVASGAWSTYIRMESCNDLIALRDTVWLATNEAGLLRYLRPRGVFESVTHEPSGLASNAVNALAFDRSGRLWAGTAGKGASRLSPAGTWDLVNAFDGLPSDSVNVLRADGDTIWIGTTRGIALWNGRLVAGSVPDLGTTSPFRSNNVTGIVVFGDSLFVGTDDGVYIARLSENLGTWVSGDAGLFNKQVARLATDGKQVLALANGATYVWQKAGATWVWSTPVSEVRNLRDDHGVIIAATLDSMCTWDGSAWHALAGAPKCDPASASGDVEMGADPAQHVFATRAGALREAATGTWPSYVPPGPLGNSEYNILHHDGATWVCSTDPQNGMSLFDGSSWRLWPGGCCGLGQDTSFVESANSFMLLTDRAGNLWTSHWDNAIERIHTGTNPTLFDHVLVSRQVARSDTLSRHSDGWSSAVDSLGFVYVGGDTPSLGEWDPMGIDVYDPNGARVITWKTTNAGLRGNQVRSISVDTRGQIWAGFAIGGVRWATLALTGTDRATLPDFTPVNGLESKLIFGVVAHGDSVWVLTTGDLERVRAGDHTVATTLDTPAGPPPKGAVHPLDVSVDGTVWVGSSNGVRMYSPGGATQDFRTDNSPLADNEVRAVFCEPGTTAVWFATAGGVNRYDPRYRAPAPPRISSLRVRSYPNPALLNGLGIALRLNGNAASYTGEVLDLNGRVVRRFGAVANGAVAWDGRDGDGTLVRAGVYFIHAHGGGQETMVRVVVLR